MFGLTRPAEIAEVNAVADAVRMLRAQNVQLREAVAALTALVNDLSSVAVESDFRRKDFNQRAATVRRMLDQI